MSLRDLTSTCAAPASSSTTNPLSTAADLLLPQTARTALTRLSTRNPPTNPQPTPLEQSLLHNDLPTPPFAPPLPTGPTALFEAAFHPPSHPLPPPTPSADALVTEFAPVLPVSHPSVPHPSKHAFRTPPPRYMPYSRHIPFPHMFHPVPQSTTSQPPPESQLEAHPPNTIPALAETLPGPLKRSASWGEEFTSLETSDRGMFHARDDDRYNTSFDALYAAMYRDMASKNSTYVFQTTGEPREKRTALADLEQGIAMREMGRLSAAIVLFERALHRETADQLEKARRAQAWFLLGLSLAESDDDVRAISALEEGVSVFEGGVGEERGDNPYLMDSLVALAVSYTNELETGKAVGVIREWFELWRGRKCVPGGSRDRVEDVFWGGAEAEAVGRLAGEMSAAAELREGDAEIRVVLGVLHNLGREYGKAAHMLRYAVRLRPEDSALWNKLGATLANGGDTDDALRAYRRAVDISPRLVRAWVNVGTAYSNRSEFEKAARYYLKALCMAEEEADGGVEERMGHVWRYLQSTLVSLNRPDLQPFVDQRDFNALRQHFSF